MGTGSRTSGQIILAMEPAFALLDPIPSTLTERQIYKYFKNQGCTVMFYDVKHDSVETPKRIAIITPGPTTTMEKILKGFGTHDISGTEVKLFHAIQDVGKPSSKSSKLEKSGSEALPASKTKEPVSSVVEPEPIKIKHVPVRTNTPPHAQEETQVSKKARTEALFKASEGPVHGTPFKRVDPEKVTVDERVKSNRFEDKPGAFGSYGHKAHEDLSKTRGKGFRKEKTKKKKGSYHGGKIDTGVHSIKFD